MITISVLTLALGIGAVTSIFTLINAFVLRELPVREPTRLAWVFRLDADGQRRRLSLPLIEEIQRRQRVFATTFPWVGEFVVNAETESGMGLANVWAVTGAFHTELGDVPALGRLLGQSDVDLQRLTPSDVAVLGYGFWQRRFGGDPHVIGKTVRVEGRPFSIVGVTSRWFSGMDMGTAPDVTVPLTALPSITESLGRRRPLDDPTWMFFELGGRLQEGVTLGQARAQLESMWPEVLVAVTPGTYTEAQHRAFLKSRVQVESAAHGVELARRSEIVRPLYPLLGLAAGILLMACVQVAYVMLARAASRSGEVALRVALGATRWQLVRGFFAESALVSLMSAAAGLAVALWSSPLLAAAMTQDAAVPPLLDLRPDLRVLALATVLGVLTAFCGGIAPAWFGVGQSQAAILQQHGRTLGGSTRPLARALVVAEVALSLMLLVCAGLLAASVRVLHAAPTGFSSDGLLVVRLMAQPKGYQHIDDARYYRALVEEVTSLPGVRAAGLSNYAVAGGFEDVQVVTSGGTAPRQVGGAFAVVSPGFVETVDLRLLQGRPLAWTDDSHSPRVALVSEALSRRRFPQAMRWASLSWLGQAGRGRCRSLAWSAMRDYSISATRTRSPCTCLGFRNRTTFTGRDN